jgi:hypothetical protein
MLTPPQPCLCFLLPDLPPSELKFLLLHMHSALIKHDGHWPLYSFPFLYSFFKPLTPLLTHLHFLLTQLAQLEINLNLFHLAWTQHSSSTMETGDNNGVDVALICYWLTVSGKIANLKNAVFRCKTDLFSNKIIVML